MAEGVILTFLIMAQITYNVHTSTPIASVVDLASEQILHKHCETLHRNDSGLSLDHSSVEVGIFC